MRTRYSLYVLHEREHQQGENETDRLKPLLQNDLQYAFDRTRLLTATVIKSNKNKVVNRINKFV